MSLYKNKSFWKRPEGKTGLVFLLIALFGGGVLLVNILPLLGLLLTNTVSLVIMLVVLAGIIYTILDPKARALLWYMYKSAMRWITGLFVKIDPVAILNGYVAELEGNITTMRKQIGKLRGQMHQLQELIYNNKKEIKSNLKLAQSAREGNNRSMMILKSRKAGRLTDSNMKLEELYKKMEVMHRVLKRMYDNSMILKEDIKDQVMVKEQEQRAIHASHSAMKSAMSVISGDPDKRAMFDAAMEAITEDVASKVGEMERIMEMSANFMDSIDLKNGILESEGLEMLEKWEKETDSIILGEDKHMLLLEAEDEANVLDINTPLSDPVRQPQHRNQYDDFFDN